jgi:ATP/maltotriose-dependent transcriptional regulator MalT
MIEAGVAVVHARLGRADMAGEWLAKLIAPLELGVPWATNFTAVACDAAEAAWLIDSDQFARTIERNILEKVVQPDFRFPMRDGRLALARLCALQGRHDEAIEWFAKAREVLEEQGARPLRAIVDYDEALMYVRRGRRGDRGRAAPLVEAALSQFRNIGMTGWIRRGEELQRGIEEKSMGVAIHPDGLTPREVDVLRLIARGRTNSEIASDLTLSVRTVGRHVTNLYNKIDVRNRAEAVDYAHRHDLT